MNYYKQGDAANADKIRAAFDKKGVDVLDFGFTAKTLVYCSIGGCVQHVPYSINLMHILHSHPNYKELELPVEPKFKVGDWVVSPNGSQYLIAYIDKEDNRYLFEINEYTGEPMHYEDVQVVDGQYHLWTIADAKDGDVLATGNIICIFKKLDKDGYYIISPCIYTVKDGLEVIDDENDSIGSCGFKPASKEDRELLFRKIKESGYQWDADKKELRKIKPHYDISNFKPFDKVLVRDNDKYIWSVELFSFYRNKPSYPFRCAGNAYSQCIPFNDKTKHLLGTTDMPSEEYINW